MRGARHHPRWNLQERFYESCPRKGTAGENGLIGSNPYPVPPRPAQDSHACGWDVVTLFLTLCMRAEWSCRSAMAQGASSPWWNGRSGETLEFVAPAVAAARARVGLPPVGRVGAYAGQRAFRLL